MRANDNSSSKSQFIEVNHFRSNFSLQHRALTHTEQQRPVSEKNENF